MSRHPIRVDDAGMHWDGDTAPAVAEVFLELAPGVNVVVDAADPSTLMGWTIAREADVGSLARACIESDLAHVVESDGSGAVISCEAFHLDADWTRRATTAAVARWWMSPLDEGALMLDEAGARRRTGDIDGASRLVALALPALESLADDAANGELSGGALSELATLTRAASAATSGLSWGYPLLSMANRVDTVREIDETRLERWLEELVDDKSFGLVDVGMAGGPSIARAEVQRGYIDPHVLPPRILRWNGARSPEWTAEVDTKAPTHRIVLSVELDAAVDLQCDEASRILGFAADRTGKLIATIPMMAQGHVLLGALPINETSFDTTVFGLFDAETPTMNLRLGPLAEPLISVDRHMLDAWMLSRTAHAVVAAVNLGADEDVLAFAQSAADGFVRDAVEAAGRALTALNVPKAAADASDTPLAILVANRVAAIEAFVDRLESRLDQPAGAQPLLAELLPSPLSGSE
ncbi:hypothetical protein [Rhodococcus sovatensis]|uniref:Uncharacterized protein n=1 Tax=Rhodococcus sovatensis TaxID=1805840 RepID=A0ABZ2PKF7_9NOCA